MRLIKTEGHPLPAWNTRGVHLEDTVEAEAVAQSLVEFAATSLRKHDEQTLTRIPEQVDPMNFHFAREALAVQMELHDRIQAQEGGQTESFDFIPLDAHQRLGAPGTDRVPETSIGFSGRILAFAMDEGGFYLESPLALADIQPAAGTA